MEFGEILGARVGGILWAPARQRGGIRLAEQQRNAPNYEEKDLLFFGVLRIM